MSTKEGIDVAIVGSGPAGMQAALMLARTRKEIVVFDDPQPPRNAINTDMHDELTRTLEMFAPMPELSPKGDA